MEDAMPTTNAIPAHHRHTEQYRLFQARDSIRDADQLHILATIEFPAMMILEASEAAIRACDGLSHFDPEWSNRRAYYTWLKTCHDKQRWLREIGVMGKLQARFAGVDHARQVAA
jgi:hypothetical protein